MRHLKSLISLVCFIFFTSGMLKAGVETTSSRLSGNQIVPSASLSAKDNNAPSGMIANSVGRVVLVLIRPAVNLLQAHILSDLDCKLHLSMLLVHRNLLQQNW